MSLIACLRKLRTSPTLVIHFHGLFMSNRRSLGEYNQQSGPVHHGKFLSPQGEALGYFPQAFTHLVLISAAFNLDRMSGS